MLNLYPPGFEELRLAALMRYSILDTPPEGTFDCITSLAASILKVPFAQINLMDKDRQWTKSAQGLPVSEVDRENSFCNYTIMASDLLIVPDALEDNRFSLNPFVTGDPYIRFYAGVPLQTHDGFNIGTLCLLDLQPRTLNQEQAQQLTGLATLVMELLEARLAAKDLNQKLDMERQSVITQLKLREEQYRTLARNIPDSAVYLFDRDLRYLLAEGSILSRERTGYSKEDLEGKTIWEVAPTYSLQKLVPIYQKALNGQKTTFEVLEKDRTYLIQALPATNEKGEVYAGLVLTLDITEKRQNEKALKTERDFALQVMESMGQGLVVFKPDHTVEYVNPAFAKMGGFLIEELVGKTPFDLIPEKIYPMVEELSLDSLPEHGSSYESELMRKDGTLFDAQIVLEPIYRDGKQGGIVGVISDITTQKMVEHQLRTALEKEKELGEMKSRLISTASHEFRTPLSAIISSTELLLNYSTRWSEEKKFEILGRISQSADKITGLIEDILTYARAEDGKFNCDRARLDLPAFCRNLVKTFQLNAANGKTVQFFELGTGQETYLDEKLLSYTLTNLLSNGLKYSAPGGEVILELEWRPDTDEIVFRVKDTGIGIPLKDQPYLFEPFQRASNVGIISGTGFGLAIARRSIEAHGGRIELESIEGKGSTFTVTVPLKAILGEAAHNPFELLEKDQSKEGSLEQTTRKATENWWLIEQAIEAASSGYIITDPRQEDNPIIYTSKGFEKLTGFSSEEVLGKNGRFLEGEDRDQPALEELLKAVEEERECRVVLRNYHKDGHLLWIELHLCPVRDNVGKVIYFVGIQTDVGDHIKAQVALNQSEQKFKALVENSPDIIARLDRNGRYLYVNPTLEKISGGLIKAEHITDKTSLEAGLPYVNLPAFEEVLKQVLQTAEPAGFEIISNLPDLTTNYMEVRIVPEFSSDGKEVVSVLTIGRDISDLTRTNEALKASEKRLRAILESITDAFISLDKNWKFTYLNSKAEKLLQHSREELIGQNIWDKFPETEASISSKMYKLARKEMIPVNFEEYYTPLDTWFEAHAYPSEEGLSVYFQDISKRKRIEEELKQSEVRFRSLIELGSDIITLIGADNLIKYISPSVERMLGYKPEELIGLNWLDRLLPNERVSAQKLWLALLDRPGEIVTVELQFLHKNGSRYYREVNCQNLLHIAGVEAFVINSRDINERKLVQETLRKSEQEYRLLMEQAPDAIYICDENEKILVVNEACCGLTGYTRAELLQMNVRDLAPRSLDENRLPAGMVLTKNETVSGVRKIRRKDGSWLVVETNLRLLEDNRLVGIVRKISPHSELTM